MRKTYKIDSMVTANIIFQWSKLVIVSKYGLYDIFFDNLHICYNFYNVRKAEKKSGFGELYKAVVSLLFFVVSSCVNNP